MQDLRSNETIHKIDDETIERYETINDLLSKGVINTPEANLIQYVFATQKVLQNPDKHSRKGEYEVQHRELDSPEYMLISSFKERKINRPALEGCKQKHKRVFEDFIMKSGKPSGTTQAYL